MNLWLGLLGADTCGIGFTLSTTTVRLNPSKIRFYLRVLSLTVIVMVSYTSAIFECHKLFKSSATVFLRYLKVLKVFFNFNR
jgi:hypothetical protein